ncbi:MAG: Tm-1-like ATP-binding domain-containing protein, partial [Proteobacteria bacterium]|nr:Tm-1-like ATP-binding domain-containing protein [Pseudomonadota bacterium]
MAKTILLISTMNTKAEETLYLRRRIEARRVAVKIMDLSMGGTSKGKSEITAGQVARAGGSSITAIRASRERAKITAAMTAGAIKIAARLWGKGEIQAVVGLGGSTGSLMATDVMRALPFGAPKLMVSSTAALPGMATRYIDTGDLALFHSVVEIAGLSPLLRNVLDRAAEAGVGLARVAPASPESVRAKGTRQVAMSMFGPCEDLAQMVRARLEKAGFSVIGFSAAGVCDRAMEDMIAQKYFVGVVDLAPGAVGEFVMGGM